MRTALIILLIGTVAASGCSRLKKDDGVRFDDQRFRVQTKKADRDDRTLFTVTVGPVSQSVKGAREAGRYGGTEYCIQQYGTSLIKWSAGPDDAESALQIEGDRLVLAGQCRP